MTDQEKLEEKAFYSALKNIPYDESVVIGSYVGVLLKRLENKSEENQELKDRVKKLEKQVEIYCDV